MVPLARSIEGALTWCQGDNVCLGEVSSFFPITVFTTEKLTTVHLLRFDTFRGASLFVHVDVLWILHRSWIRLYMVHNY
jgi:hypothetical protein